jgi:signal transduction histidine kinase
VESVIEVLNANTFKDHYRKIFFRYVSYAAIPLVLFATISQWDLGYRDRYANLIISFLLIVNLYFLKRDWFQLARFILVATLAISVMVTVHLDTNYNSTDFYWMVVIICLLRLFYDLKPYMITSFVIICYTLTQKFLKRPSFNDKEAYDLWLLDFLDYHTSLIAIVIVIFAYEYVNRKLEEKLKEQEGVILNQSKLASINELAASISHEVNNPLTVVTGLSHKGMNKAESAETREIFSRIHAAAFRIAGITKHLKMMTGKEAYNVEQIEIKDLIKKIIEKKEFKRAQLKIETIFQSKLETLDSSEVILQTICEKLIENAIDEYDCNNDINIKVLVQDIEDEFSISIIDTGQEIPKEIKEKMFDPLYTTKPLGTRVGMGLSVAYKAATTLGAQLDYKRINYENYFRLRIPLKNKS